MLQIRARLVTILSSTRRRLPYGPCCQIILKSFDAAVLKLGRVTVKVARQEALSGLIEAATGKAIYRGAATDEPVEDMIEDEAEGLEAAE